MIVSSCHYSSEKEFSMKSVSAILLSLCILLFFAVSCSDGSSASPHELTIDASSQKDVWFPAGRFTDISINSMDPTVLYAVKTKNGGARGLVSRDNEPSDNILTTEVGTNIPIPDEDCSCNFVGGDVNITTEGEISVVELKAGTDLTLYATGEPDFITEEGERVWEEYYYVDLTQPPFDFTPEEKKRLTLFTEGTGSGSGCSDWAMVSTNFSAIVDEYSGMFGAFDLTGHDAVILYNKIGILSGSDWTRKISIKPTLMLSCDSSVTEINDYYEVLQVDTSTATPGKEYVLVMEKYEPGWYGLDEWSASMTRFLDGRSRDFAIPIASNEPSASVVYLGEIDPSKDFLIDFPVFDTDHEPRHYADVYIREISDYERNLASIILTTDNELVFSVDVPAHTSFKYPVLVRSEDKDKTLKNNLFVSIECNELNGGVKGDFYGRGYTETYFNSSHSYGVGMSGNALYGSSGSHLVSDSDYLETFCLYAYSNDKPLRFTVTITRSDEPLRWEPSNPSFWKVTIIPNNGEGFRTENVQTDEPYGRARFTFPAAPSRPGYSFAGWGLNGMLYQPGTEVDIMFHNSVVAVWDSL